MEIKRVRERGDGVKQVTVPADSDIEEGDYVKIHKIEGQPGNIDHLGFQIQCGHIETEDDHFGDIPLEHSADMAACKECYIKATPRHVLEDEGVEIPEDVEPGKWLSEGDSKST
ncbi:hypothetical protein ACM16X_02380 [Haloarcula japonica]|uniref:hypothetical protein n=1 Tax=Haloarcula japonica TaxID=29282 RepID=UPI0039F6EE5D